MALIPAPTRKFTFASLLAALLLSVPLHPARSQDAGDTAAEKDRAENAAEGNEGAPAPAKAADRSLAGSYLSGRFARGQGDMGRASEYAMDALANDPDNQELLTHAFRLQLSSGNFAKAFPLAQKLAGKSDRDPSVDLVRMIEQVQKKDYNAAAKILDVQEAEGFSAVMIPLMASWLDFARGKVTSPVALDEVTSGAGNLAPFVYYHLALLNDAAGQSAEAEKNFTKASTETAKTPYRVVEAFAGFYRRQGQPEKADELLENYRKANPESYLTQDNLDREMTQSAPPQAKEAKTRSEKKKSKQVTETTPPINTAEAGIAEIFFAVASLLYGDDTTADAMAFTYMALALRPDFPQAQLMLASLHEQSGDSAQAMKFYNAIDPKSPLAAKAKLRVALNMDRMNQTALALSQLDAAARVNPASYDVLLTRGDILRNRERFAEAAAAYSEALKRIGTPQKQHWPIFFVRAIAYERAGLWPKAEADLKKALVLEPDQPDVLNYLGYSWLTMGRNIDEAKQMIGKAMEQRPADAQIVDSMGWALYSLGEYEDAQDYLERAVELLPSDPTVNDHLGDLYWRIHRQTEAKYQWERALIFEKEAKTIAAIRRKIATGLPEAAIKAPPKPVERTAAKKTAAPETATAAKP